MSDQTNQPTEEKEPITTETSVSENVAAPISDQNTDEKSETEEEDNAVIAGAQAVIDAITMADDPLLKFTIDWKKESARKIFLAYTNENEMVSAVLKYLEKLELQVIRTKSPKSELISLNQISLDNPHVNFAIVILSNDENCFPLNGKPGQAVMRTDPNTIFELGYWVGKIGRDRVFALHYEQKNFRIPTQYFDTIFTPYERSGLWQKELKKRLTNAGFEIKS